MENPCFCLFFCGSLYTITFNSVYSAPRHKLSRWKEFWGFSAQYTSYTQSLWTVVTDFCLATYVKRYKRMVSPFLVGWWIKQKSTLRLHSWQNESKIHFFHGYVQLFFFSLQKWKNPSILTEQFEFGFDVDATFGFYFFVKHQLSWAGRFVFSAGRNIHNVHKKNWHTNCRNFVFSIALKIKRKQAFKPNPNCYNICRKNFALLKCCLFFINTLK